MGDSSFLAKLEDVEQKVEHENTNVELHTAENVIKQSCENDLTNFTEDVSDSVLRDLPSSQLAFQQDVTNRQPGFGMEVTSTPDVTHTKQSAVLSCNDKKPAQKARRSMTDQLKKAMLENAATSNGVSKTALQKEAVMNEEMSVALQAIESLSMEGDLGPFFGLPSKVKDLIMRLKGIQDLYGD